MKLTPVECLTLEFVDFNKLSSSVAVEFDANTRLWVLVPRVLIKSRQIKLIPRVVLEEKYTYISVISNTRVKQHAAPKPFSNTGHLGCLGAPRPLLLVLPSTRSVLSLLNWPTAYPPYEISSTCRRDFCFLQMMNHEFMVSGHVMLRTLWNSNANKANHDGAHEDRADSQGRPAASEEAHHSEEAGHLVLFGLQEEGALGGKKI